MPRIKWNPSILCGKNAVFKCLSMLNVWKPPRIKGETTGYIRPNTYTNQEWNHKLYRGYLPLNKSVKIETKKPNIHNQMAGWKYR
jgi:hypothetical protein